WIKYLPSTGAAGVFLSDAAAVIKTEPTHTARGVGGTGGKVEAAPLAAKVEPPREEAAKPIPLPAKVEAEPVPKVEDVAARPEATTSLKDPSSDASKMLDTWFANKDEKVQGARSEAARIQDQIKATVGAKHFRTPAKDVDQAIQLNIDLRGKVDEQIAKWGDKLTPEQRTLVEKSQNLTPEQLAIADAIIESNRGTGIEAQDAGVIKNVNDNYSARLWETEPGKRPEQLERKFGTTTARAKQRTLESILEGWAKGKKLAIKG
ncbi:unnamed protein product, partial [marine sediment metagenome]